MCWIRCHNISYAYLLLMISSSHSWLGVIHTYISYAYLLLIRGLEDHVNDAYLEVWFFHVGTHLSFNYCPVPI